MDTFHKQLLLYLAVSIVAVGIGTLATAIVSPFLSGLVAGYAAAVGHDIVHNYAEEKGWHSEGTG